MSIAELVYNRLNNNNEINSAVSSNIFPVFRDDRVPSIVYSVDLEKSAEDLGGVGVSTYEITITAVATKFKTASEIADSVQSYLDYSDWQSDGYRVLGCFLRDRVEDYIERASKNDRLATIEIRFELQVVESD